MKTGSKRGAALAYVIVITAALLILAAALISTAKFNLDASQNSLEGRQAYLDAKSAIEYGRAYLSLNPEKADTSFTILRDGSALGFKIGASGAANYVAKYDKDEKAINAAAKYKSSDRVRRLGYQFGTADGGQGNSCLNDFLITGSLYGANYLFSFNDQNIYQDASSIYPILSHIYRQIQGNIKVEAPLLYILGKNGDGDSVIIYNTRELTLKSDFIYLAGGIYSYNDAYNRIYQPCYLQSYTGTDGGIIYFGKDVINNNTNKMIAKGGKYYYFKNNINLFNIAEGDLQEVDANKLPVYESKTYTDSLVSNNIIIVSGDKWTDNNGVKWSDHGKIIGSTNGVNSGDGNTATYILYNKAIEDNSHWFPTELTKVNNEPSYPDYKKLFVYWYLNDVSTWGDALFGNGNAKSNQYYQNVTNIYPAKEIYLRYVNIAKSNFIVPEYKTVAFKADKISLSTEYNDTVVGAGDNRPCITHAGAVANFILEAQDASKSVDLSVPNDIMVQYKNSTGITQSYTIKAGSYSVIKLNLFSGDAKTFFTTHTPTNPPGDSGGGSGGTGDVDLTSGVYTNG